jgi:peptidyl-prolyl cis-trans isomerase D
MATLEKIRSKAGLLVGIVGLALFAFIIGDFLQSGSTFFRQTKEKVAFVDGQSIGIQDYQKEAEMAVNNYKNRAGASITEEQQNQIRQMVFEKKVGLILLNEQSEKLGFVISKEEYTDLIMGNNISPTIKQISIFQNPQTGTFDKNALLQFIQVIESDDWRMYSPEVQQQLKAQKASWTDLKKNVTEQKLLSKYSTLLMSAIVSNSLDAKAAFNDNAVNVDFNIVSQLYYMIPDTEVEVSDAEIAKLYESRKNNFKQERAKVINYIAVNILPSETDYSDTSNRIEKLRDELTNTTNPADLVNENSDVPFVDAYISESQLSYELKSFIETASIGDIDGPNLTDRTYSMSKLLSVKQAPDSIKVNQIMFPGSDESVYKAKIDSIIKVINSGKSFADIATEETGGQTNGDIGWQTELSLANGIDIKFANALFDAKVNEPFVVTSPYGIHLVQIVEKTKPVKKYKMASIKMEVTPSQETYNKLYNNLNQYVSNNNNVEKFKSSASEAGYFCQMGVQILENQNNISNIENTRQVIRWANSNKKGAISDIFECQNYFIVVSVEGELKAGFRSLSEVSDILKRELIDEKKGQKIIENIKAKNLNSLEDYATAMNSTVQDVKFVTFATPRITAVGIDPVVNAHALASEVGGITGPFAGNNGIYVLSLTNKTESDQPYDEASQKMQMNMQNSYRIMQLIQNNSLLKDKATIVDNRSRFY